MRTTVWMLAGAVFVGAQREAVVPDPAACRSVVLVVPRDEWRLTITQDGAVRINYAALPQAAVAGPNSLPFPDVLSGLGARVRRSCPADGSGTVEFVTGEGEESRAVWCLADEAYAAGLFERAWSQVGRPAKGVEREHVELLHSMWARRRAPRAGR